METSVLGGLSSLSPVCGQFHRHTGQGILDTGFHRRHHTFVIRCLVFGVDQDGAQGVEGLVVSPAPWFFKILASFSDVPVI